MDLKFDVLLSNQDEEIQKFIYDSTKNKMYIEPADESNFTNIEIDRRDGTDFIERDFDIFVTEEWALMQKGSSEAKNKVLVAKRQQLKISMKYCLFFQNGISENAKTEGRNLFKSYDPAIHGSDIQKWALPLLGPELKEGMFIIHTGINLEKISELQDYNTAQRDALLALYGQGESDATSDLKIIDSNLKQWADERKSFFLKIGEELFSGKIEPKQYREVRDVPPGKMADDVYESVIDDILSKIVPMDCAPTRKNQIKLLNIFAWPEFKVEWKSIRIKIGCSEITFVYPVLRVRISTLVLYVYYSVPQNTLSTSLKIAETCAIRAALGGAVLGAIVGNFAVAVGAFNSLFKTCIEREILNCVNPGILTLIEAGNWN